MRDQAEVASITFTPTNGSAAGPGDPDPGPPIVIPGLLEIRIGGENSVADGGHAKASADVLDALLVPPAPVRWPARRTGWRAASSGGCSPASPRRP